MNCALVLCLIFNVQPSEQGFLDEQFRQLEELQDDLSPNFVEEVVNSFFRDSARLIASVEQTL